MNYSNIQNPKWMNAEHTIIDCVVFFDAIPGPTPFAANSADTTPHSQAIFADIVAGTWGPIAEYVAPPEPQNTATPPAGEIPQAVL